MAYEKKQHKPSWFVPNNLQKKSLFQPPRFPALPQITAPTPTTDKTKYRQPKPGAMIKNVWRSMGMDESIYPRPKEEAIQKQETTQIETPTEYKLPRQSIASPHQDSRITNSPWLTEKQLLAPKREDRQLETPPWLTGKQLLAPKRADETYRPSGNQLNAPPQSSTSNGEVVQAKLTIGKPDDKYEQEADRGAAEVVQEINRPAPVSLAQDEEVQDKKRVKVGELYMKPMPAIREPEAMEERGSEIQMIPLVQRREAIGGGEASNDWESAINRARGRGQPLSARLQQSMGEAMGADFSGVRVHTDAQANQLNRALQAKAFTTGQDLFFKKGEYQPGSRGGQELIAHELTHVVQQKGATDIDTQGIKIQQRKEKGTIQRQAVFCPGTEAAGHPLTSEGKAYWVYGTGNTVLSSDSFGSCVGMVVYDAATGNGLVAHFWNPSGQEDALTILKEWKRLNGVTDTATAIVFGGTTLNSNEPNQIQLAKKFTKPRIQQLRAIAGTFLRSVSVEAAGHGGVSLRCGVNGGDVQWADNEYKNPDLM